VPPTVPEALKVRKLRAAGAAGALAVLASLAGAFAFESIATRQELRRPHHKGPRSHKLGMDREAARLVTSPRA
jgi:hypothetical protein